MTPSKSLQRFVHKHVAGLCICMNLSHFNIKVHFCKLKDATMDIEVDYRYLEAMIRMDIVLVTKMWRHDKSEILAYLAHELTHCITQEMSDPFASKTECLKETKQQIHFEERVTETVSRLALRLYKLENKL